MIIYTSVIHSSDRAGEEGGKARTLPTGVVAVCGRLGRPWGVPGDCGPCLTPLVCVSETPGPSSPPKLGMKERLSNDPVDPSCISIMDRLVFSRLGAPGACSGIRPPNTLVLWYVCRLSTLPAGDRPAWPPPGKGLLAGVISHSPPPLRPALGDRDVRRAP